MANQNSTPPRNVSANNKMLIDATHPEETRVVVQRNGRVEEFDFESAARKLLRGNIYLAKVTRVEPSLQAAFIDYGGNRHGFLAFNEIHPDYYQIPVADRRALIEAEAAAEAEEEAAADRAAEAAERRSRRRGSGGGQDQPRRSEIDEIGGSEDRAVDVSSLLPAEPFEGGASDPRDDDRTGDSDTARTMPERSEPDAILRGPEPLHEHEAGGEAHQSDTHDHVHGHDHGHEDVPRADTGGGYARRDDAGEAGTGEGRVETVEPAHGADAEQIETVSDNEDVLEEVPVRPRRRLRSYKIQEVTKRRQVLLVQVVKEERGTKGAALTTYLSLAGRYTVLMPNTARGGGISRKITQPQDRKRLKAIAAELDVPEGMGLIIRTAGAARTKQEIKRDYEYLLRLWESVRELALGSNAPALVYEEGNLIKRSIRDLYGKEVEEIIVAGDVAYREAKDFMRMLMPSHAKNVIEYKDPEPLFTRFGMERQLNAMFSPYVHLRSGGYLVINQTEALVAIDINSGKSTREFSIEETALSTNLEAADEIARQLKLRDLAGLIVIDFIDMEEKRNNRNVERRIKDALRHDRARIQLGRISHFGLLEMSRQRMRTGVLEGSTTQCPHCQGTGIIRSTESVALAVLRGIEDSLMTGQPSSMIVSTTAMVALYILNNKRSFIVEIENRYGITIQIQASEKIQGANFNIERLATRREEPQRRPQQAAVNMDWGFEDEDQAAAVEVQAEADVDDEEEAPRSGDGDSDRDGAQGEGEGGRRRRKRRRGRRGDREPGGEQQPIQGQRDDDGDAPVAARGNDDQPDIVDEPKSRHGRRDDRRGRQDRGPRRDQPRRDEARDGEGRDGEPRVDEVEEDDADYVEAVGGEGREGDDADGDEVAPRPDGGDGDGQADRKRRRRRGRRGGRRNQERDRPGMAEGGDAGFARDVNHRGEAGQGARHPDNNGAENQGGEGEPRQPSRHDQPIAADRRAEAEPAGSEPAVFDPVPAPRRAPRFESPIQSRIEPEEPIAERVRHVPPPAAEDAEAVPVPAPAPMPTPRSAPVASEPVLERVVVGREAAGTPGSEDEAARPARRGWWQRR